MAEPDTITLSEERRDLGFDAACELEAIKAMLTDLCSGLGIEETDQLALVQLRLKVRGLTARMDQLLSVVMSVLTEDDDTASLFKKVHGHAQPAQGQA